jgi:hypothetical protein
MANIPYGDVLSIKVMDIKTNLELEKGCTADLKFKISNRLDKVAPGVRGEVKAWNAREGRYTDQQSLDVGDLQPGEEQIRVVVLDITCNKEDTYFEIHATCDLDNCTVMKKNIPAGK